MTDWVIAALGPEDRAAALRLLRETGAEQRRPLFVEPQLPTTGWVARDGDGRLVGLASGVDKPGRTKIRITVAADPAWRGRGVALWLKTTILATLPADLRYVTTENNAANAPMLAVNRRLGFRPYQHQVAWESDHPR
jgi:GNAT superfamily N-acetyltransferase